MARAHDLAPRPDTATIARNFAENGIQVFFPQINWGGAGPGYVETEFPLMPRLSVALYQVFGEHVFLERLVSLAFMRCSRSAAGCRRTAGLAALVAPAAWLWHAAGLHVQYGNTFGVISGGDSKWGGIALWLSPAFYGGNLKIDVLFVFGVVGVPLAVIGAVWAWRRGTAVLPVLLAGAVSLLVYYFATGRYSGSDLGIQYHVYSLPYAAIATGLGLAVAARWLRPRVSTAVFGGLAATVGQGARFVVEPDPGLAASSVLGRWLASNATQLHSTTANRCDIWALPAPSARCAS